MSPRLSPADEVLAQVRTISFRFPGTSEKVSHGAPAFFVRGRMFAMFADDHHGDGRVAVWCKSSADEQQRRVGEAPERFFVPPYVGVSGWVGVRLDRADVDWGELAIVLEEAWLAAAPRSAVNDPVRPPPRSPALPRTDPELARAARQRLIEICAKLPESTCDEAKRHVTFRVARKPYAYFLDNYERDGVVSACVKLAPKERATSIAKTPKHWYVPKYLGAHGWVGRRLDVARVDWKDLEARIAWSYRGVAPKRLVSPPPAPKAPRKPK